MYDNRLPKQLFYGDLTGGKRGTGRPKLRYKDSLKANLKDSKIDVATWEKQAVDRTKWRATSNRKVNESEQTKRMNKVAKQADIKTRPPTVPTNTTVVCQVCGRVCISNFGLQSHMRVHK